MPDTRARTLVMTGRLADFRLADVLQVVGLSRQYTAVELRRADDTPQGTIFVKAGRVIGAERDGRHGRAAFLDMFGAPAELFVVSRLPEPAAYPQPLGPLATLLMEALERARTPEPLPPPPAKQRVAQGSSVVPLPTASEPPRRSGAPRAVAVGTAPGAEPRAAEPRRAASGSTPPLRPVTPLARPRRDARDSAPPAAPGPVDQAWDTAPTSASGGSIAVAIASPKGGVGKTTITLNLALAMAQRGRRTIVIDADVNGDLMSLLAARDQVPRGAYDILERADEDGLVDEVLRGTAVAGLRILPASGPPLPAVATARRSFAAEWRALIAQARRRADVVLVDCPAGMFDTTADVLAACTHVVGVLASDMVASRSAEMLDRGLAALPEGARPKLAGVVVNMFHGRSHPSLEAFGDLAAVRGSLLFETTIPRSDAFAAASLAGVPLRFAEAGGRPSPIAWLFEALATEVFDRTGLAEPARAAAPARFLL